MTRYPSLEEVRATHSRLIDRFGGSHGLRDRAALQAALGRLQTGYYADVIEEAAAPMESLSQNHPFIDGKCQCR
ncbi:MAG: type II toxin-antitoxin system death-on-curing family toxin [Acidobacteriota bacterium]